MTLEASRGALSTGALSTKRQKEVTTKEKKRIQQQCATDAANQVTWQRTAEQGCTACQKHRGTKNRNEQRNVMTQTIPTTTATGTATATQATSAYNHLSNSMWFCHRQQLTTAHHLPNSWLGHHLASVEEDATTTTWTRTKATDEDIPVHGYKWVFMHNINKQTLAVPFYACDVTQPIMSVKRLAEQGFNTQLSDTPTIAHRKLKQCKGSTCTSHSGSTTSQHEA